MGKARTSKWYDEHLYAAEEPLALAQARPYYQILFQLGAEWVLNQQPRIEQVIDLGCGQALFADALAQRGYFGDYWGLDFSTEALRLAVRRLADCFQFSGWSVFQFDAEQDKTIPLGPNPNICFTCFEVLEHLASDADKRLMHMLPEGAKIAFSVPTFDSECHERTFESPQAAIQRYRGVIQINPQATRVIPVRHDRSIFFMTGVRI